MVVRLRRKRVREPSLSSSQEEADSEESSAAAIDLVPGEWLKAARLLRVRVDGLLDARVRLQQALHLVSRLPYPTKYEAFCNGNREVAQLQAAASAAGRALVGQWLLAATESPGYLENRALTDFETALDHAHQSLLRRRQEVLERWHQEVELHGHASLGADSDSPLQAFNQGLESHLRRFFTEHTSRERLRRVFQTRRDGCQPIGGGAVATDCSRMYDPEHFDDAELFYRLMQQRLAEANWDRRRSSAHEAPVSVAALVRSGALDPTTALVIERARHRLRKYAPEERRASKGRRLLYAQRDRLVGFMAPRPLSQVRQLPGPLPMET